MRDTMGEFTIVNKRQLALIEEMLEQNRIILVCNRDLIKSLMNPPVISNITTGAPYYGVGDIK